LAAGAPGVVAEIVTGVVAMGVLAVVPNVNVTVAGRVETEAEGEKPQVTPAGRPLEHVRVTAPLNDPAPVTWNVTPADVLPCGTEMLAGDGAPSPKSTTCSVTVAS